MTAEIPDTAFAYLTTEGRVSGHPHEIEIWYGAAGSTIYLLAGGGRSSDWVRNLRATPAAVVRIDDRVWEVRARVVTDEREGEDARRLLAAKYQGWREGDQMSDWAQHALCIALDLGEEKTR